MQNWSIFKYINPNNKMPTLNSVKPTDFFWSDFFEIGMVEYDSNSINTPNIRSKKVKTGGLITHGTKMQFSVFRLAVAIAKTILTRDPHDIDLVKEVRAALYMLDSSLCLTNSDFRLNHNFRQKYRDFSKSSRIGELAQAMSFIFAQEILKYPVVMDFKGYLRSEKIPNPPNNLRTPDFALFFKPTRWHNPSLMESKGTSPNKKSTSVKTNLQDALDQCSTGSAYILANAKPSYHTDRHFGTSLVASQSSDTWPSFFAFCDPEVDAKNGIRDPIGVARQYYSVWLLIAGQKKLSQDLLESRLSLSQLEMQAGKYYINSANYYAFYTHHTFNLFTPLLAKQKGAPKRRLPNQWFVRCEIIDAIVNNDVYALKEITKQLVKIDDLHVSDDTSMSFQDGTHCRRRS